MAVRKFILCLGQSNSSPTSASGWIAAHPELDLSDTQVHSVGPYNDKFTVPGGFGEVDLKGAAHRGVRYLTWYNPYGSGYQSFPCEGRVATVFMPYEHRPDEIYVEQTFIGGTPPAGTQIVRALTGTVHTVTDVSDLDMPTD